MSDFPSNIVHTQTLSKDTQIFEPLSNHKDNKKDSSKIYYVLYPREQIAIKYKWGKE